MKRKTTCRPVLIFGACLTIAILPGCGQQGALRLLSPAVADDDRDNASLLTESQVAPAPQPRGGIELIPLGGHEHGGTSGAEISAFDATSRHLLTVNGAASTIDIQNISDPRNPLLLASVSVASLGRPTSIAAKHGLIAAAVASKDKHHKGHVVFLSPEGDILSQLEVGYEPDMLTFTPDGQGVLVANEAEPTSDYEFDPPASISMISTAQAPRGVTQADVISLGFEQFDSQRKSLDPSIRIYAKARSVSQDLEPEYIAVSPDSRFAWVTCQENNAIATIDLGARQITKLSGLGFKDHNVAGQGLDASDKDKAIRIRPWPVRGMYQPDGMAAFTVNGQTYLVTANEGELREYVALNEQSRVAELQLNPKNFPQQKALQEKTNLGRLRVSNAFGDVDGDGRFEELYSAGTRSFSIWSADVAQVYDSGDEFERILADKFPQQFNSDHESVSFDDRSDNKGCEPEAVAIGEVDGRTYAFIVLERMGGVLVYDVSRPQAPVFETLINTRDFATGGGDSGPEGVLFISPEYSPNGNPLLVVSYEISGTTRIFEIRNHSAPVSVRDDDSLELLSRN